MIATITLLSERGIVLPCAARCFETRDVNRVQTGRRKFVAPTQKILGTLFNLQSTTMHFRHVSPPERSLAPVSIDRAVVLTVGEAFSGHQQSQIKFVLLAARLIDLPFTNID